MNTSLKKELPMIVLVIVPFVYLMYIYPSLPELVPMHWNYLGEIDRMGDKWTLVLLPILLPLMMYGIMTIAPKVDPNNKIELMGNKYHQLKLILVLYLSVLTLMLLYSIKNQSFSNVHWVTLSIGVLFMIIGNFSKTIKPNRFIGIKTPWTLKNESVWKSTHLLGGKMWLIGGLLVVFSSLILDIAYQMTVFLTITGVITVVPIVYSYFEFRRLQKG